MHNLLELHADDFGVNVHTQIDLLAFIQLYTYMRLYYL